MVLSELVNTHVVLINYSVNPSYSRIANYNFGVFSLVGERVAHKDVAIAPFGIKVLDVSELTPKEVSIREMGSEDGLATFPFVGYSNDAALMMMTLNTSPALQSVFVKNTHPSQTYLFPADFSSRSILKSETHRSWHEMLAKSDGNQRPLKLRFRTLEVKIDIPKAVAENIQPLGTYYFWDWFYIWYTNALRHTSFVHGVDKTHNFHEGQDDAVDGHQPRMSYHWSPEAPIDIDGYTKLEVILINRTSSEALVTMVLADSQDASISWSVGIPCKGVRRFELTPESVGDLERKELKSAWKE